MLILVEHISHYNLLNISSYKYKYIYFKKKYTVITKPLQCFEFQCASKLTSPFSDLVFKSSFINPKPRE